MTRRVILFSGHRVDEPGRTRPRFPAAKVDAAAQRIGAVLDTLGAGPADLAFCQGAAGGDLLFAQACAARQVPLVWLLPVAEAAFVAESVQPADADWLSRYATARATLAEPPRIAEGHLGPPAPGEDLWERGNRWLLDTALAAGGGTVTLITLWDGAAGDGPGGTRHMVDEVRRRGGRVHWIDTRTL
jgi:hypothetical protein